MPTNEIQLGLCDKHKYIAYQGKNIGIGDCKDCVQALIDNIADYREIQKEMGQEAVDLKWENKKLRKALGIKLVKVILEDEMPA